MWIELHNLHAKVVRATDDEREWLSEYLSFPDAKAQFRQGKTPKWKRGDGKIHMMNAVTQTFPTGFIEQVTKAAKEDGMTVQTLEKRRAPCKPDPTALTDWLRSYQLEALEIAKQNSRGVFHHPTGAGKTEVMVGVAEIYPVRWLILTHRKDLLGNTSERFLRRTGEEIGTIGEGLFDPKRVTVAMFQTLYAGLRTKNKRVLEFLKTVQGVMIDEVHIVPAATYWRVLMAMENAYFRFGFSGTPFARGDQKSIFTWGAVGPVIHRIRAETLIDAGVLAKPEIRMARVQAAPIDAATWVEAYDQLVVRSAKRNRAVLAAVAKATKPCLLFVNHVEHGRILEAGMREQGTNVEFVWGKHHTSQRKSAIERLVQGMTDVLICNVIFQEGIDIPELQSVVIAQGGKSIIAALQRVGRGMRKRSRDGEITKETFKVFDIADVGCGCRAPKKHRGCKWMESHAKHRTAAYTSERYSVIQET